MEYLKPFDTYSPKNINASIWLQAAQNRMRTLHKTLRTKQSPFEVVQCAIEQGHITQREYDSVMSASQTIAEVDVHVPLQRLWHLNGKTFPLTYLEKTEGELIIPPSLSLVLEEYVLQIDYVGSVLIEKLHETNADFHRIKYVDGNHIRAKHNPAYRHSPQQFYDWMSQWLGPEGPPITQWSKALATSFAVPSIEDVFEKWNTTLCRKRIRDKNGIHVTRDFKWNEKRADTSTVQERKFPVFDVDALLENVAVLQEYPRSKRQISVESVRVSQKIISDLMSRLVPIDVVVHVETLDLAQHRHREMLKKYQKDSNIRNGFQVRWTNALAATNDICLDIYGRSLEGLHREIVNDVALRVLGMLDTSITSPNLRKIFDRLTPHIGTGPIVRPLYR